MVEISNLTVSVGGKCVLRGVDMRVRRGEVAALFGPNGSGKTTLLNAIIGMPGYKVDEGRIAFKGEDITGLPMDERARRGIGMAFQRPPAVRGVKLSEVLRECMAKRGGATEEGIAGMLDRLNLGEFGGRDVNLGFSGGELKRSELVQLMAQDPDFIMLDEPDSGVDLVSVQLVGRVINEMLEKDVVCEKRRKAGLIISHAGHILDYVNADRAYVMLGGRGRLVGEVPGVKAHLECRGLILSEKGRIYAIPELEGLTSDVDMSHEAAVGKIAEEEIAYLMARGLSPEEATSAIIRGFLDVEVKGLPARLEREMKNAVRAGEAGGL